MVSNRVILSAIPKLCPQQAVLGCSHLPMVERNLIRKCPCLPTFHPRGDDCNMIDTTAFHRHISADLLKTPTPKNLAGSGHVLNIDEAIVVNRIRPFLERSPNQSQARILS